MLLFIFGSFWILWHVSPVHIRCSLIVFTFPFIISCRNHLTTFHIQLLGSQASLPFSGYSVIKIDLCWKSMKVVRCGNSVTLQSIQLSCVWLRREGDAAPCLISQTARFSPTHISPPHFRVGPWMLPATLIPGAGSTWNTRNYNADNSNNNNNNNNTNFKRNLKGKNQNKSKTKQEWYKTREAGENCLANTPTALQSNGGMNAVN